MEGQGRTERFSGPTQARRTARQTRWANLPDRILMDRAPTAVVYVIVVPPQKGILKSVVGRNPKTS